MVVSKSTRHTQIRGDNRRYSFHFKMLHIIFHLCKRWLFQVPPPLVWCLPCVVLRPCLWNPQNFWGIRMDMVDLSTNWPRKKPTMLIWQTPVWKPRVGWIDDLRWSRMMPYWNLFWILPAKSTSYFRLISLPAVVDSGWWAKSCSSSGGWKTVTNLVLVHQLYYQTRHCNPAAFCLQREMIQPAIGSRTGNIPTYRMCFWQTMSQPNRPHFQCGLVCLNE